MTLDEAIKHAEEAAKENQKQADSNILIDRDGTKFLYDGEVYRKCCKCAEEHRQLAEWLKELKQLREQKCDRENSEIMKEVKDLSKRFDTLINQMKEDKEAQLEKLKEEIRLQKRSLDWKERIRNAHTRPN